MTESPVDDAYAVVYGVLGGRPSESLTQAARRILASDRPSLEALEVARRVLTMTGKSGPDQHATLFDCAELIRRHDERKRRRHGR